MDSATESQPQSQIEQQPQKTRSLQEPSVRSIVTLGQFSALGPIVHQKKKLRWYERKVFRTKIQDWGTVIAGLVLTWIVIGLYFWAQLEISIVIRATDYLVIPNAWYLNTYLEYEHQYTTIPGTPLYGLGRRPLFWNRVLCQNKFGNGQGQLGQQDWSCAQYPQYPWQKKYYKENTSLTAVKSQQAKCATTDNISAYSPDNYQEDALNGDLNKLKDTCLFGLYKPQLVRTT